MLIADKKALIAAKSSREEELHQNLKKIDKFAQEKLSEGKYYQEVFKAFKLKLLED